MSTFTQILYQLVWSTKYREPTLVKHEREKLYRFIWGLFKNKHCHLYRIGGMEDHIHIITHIHPSISLASLVKNIKLASDEYIKQQHIFPFFNGWQAGYGGFTYSFKEKDRLIAYVMNQEMHHQEVTYIKELMDLLEEHGITYDERYLM